MPITRSLRILAATGMLLLALLSAAAAAADGPGAWLKARDATMGNRDTAVLSGGGFGPGELVSLFVTFPDGRVIAATNTVLNQCCPQADQVLADGTGGFSFQLVFDIYQSYPSTTGSATDNTQFTNNLFTLPPEFAAAAPPYGVYTVTALGRVSLQKATATFRITPPGFPAYYDYEPNTTGTLAVFTTIGHLTSAKQTDPIERAANAGVATNPNVDIACNGLIPGEFVAFWDTYPDGSAVTLSTLVADDGGAAVLQLDLLTGKFPTGLHTFSCRGMQSHYYLRGSFLLLPGLIPAQSAIGSLTVSYVGASRAVVNASFPQLPSFFASDYLLLTARNFRPNETVTFWQTFPDQSAHFLATVKANEAGAAVLVIQLFPGPIAYQVGRAVLGDAALYQIAYPAGVDGRIPDGRHWFSARGDTTVRTASAPFDLLPSQVDP